MALNNRKFYLVAHVKARKAKKVCESWYYVFCVRFFLPPNQTMRFSNWFETQAWMICDQDLLLSTCRVCYNCEMILN